MVHFYFAAVQLTMWYDQALEMRDNYFKYRFCALKIVLFFFSFNRASIKPSVVVS